MQSSQTGISASSDETAQRQSEETAGNNILVAAIRFLFPCCCLDVDESVKLDLAEERQRHMATKLRLQEEELRVSKLLEEQAKSVEEMGACVAALEEEIETMASNIEKLEDSLEVVTKERDTMKTALCSLFDANKAVKQDILHVGCPSGAAMLPSAGVYNIDMHTYPTAVYWPVVFLPPEVLSSAWVYRWKKTKI